MANILCIEHDTVYCDSLSTILQSMGHEIICTGTLEHGLDVLRSRNFDIVLLEVKLPDGNGLEVISDILETPQTPDVIIITDLRTPDDAKTAIEKGAWCYIHKSLSRNELSLLIINVLEYRKQKAGGINPDPLTDIHFEGIIGSSPAIKFCKFLASNVAKIEANVFIAGETGTGKELFASAIHQHSPRADNNFVTVDCTALPAELIESILFGYEKGAFTGALKSRNGLIKQADKGTLFLDEVGELPLPMQSALLRVIQERRFRPVGSHEEIQSDFRLISASNRDLESMVRAGTFRNDLLFRLRAFTIEAPPLRKHARDIHELTRHYTSRLCGQYGIAMKAFDPSFFHYLEAYSWPGNVRELIHAVESALVSAQDDPVLFSRHLPNYIRIWLTRTSLKMDTVYDTSSKKIDDTVPIPPLKDIRDIALAHTEEHYLKDLLHVSNGDIKTARRLSGLSRTRLYVLLKKYGIPAGSLTDTNR